MLLIVHSKNLNSLSYFQTHEKEVYLDPTRSLISMLVKKRPVRVLIRFLVFKLMKKRFTGPNSLPRFKAREKKTRWGLNSLSCFQDHEKEVYWTQLAPSFQSS